MEVTMRSRRRRFRPSRALSFIVALALGGGVAVVALADVPASVDSYGGNSAAAGVHAIAGSNNDPNFQNGAVGNRYPLAQANQDVSPATQAVASVSDVGPLVLTVAGNDCNAPPPNPIPNPNPSPESTPSY